jgi:Asp-tRNA(Asn)/Glu-tRNA(Gln) amidotransferase A subunit family amidase
VRQLTTSTLTIVSLLASGAAFAQSALRATPFEVHEASIRDLQTAMEQRRTSAAALVDAYLARIAAYDAAGPTLNAMIALNPRARMEAEALDRERQAGRVRGPMHGVPIILKDNYDTGDLPTSAGSLALADSRPADDAFVVRKLRAAGAVILGKANMHELASGITNISSLGGQTRNPYDPTRCPGGSSGGTGAAIAASFAAVGWGSDTCGSIRIPSAFNNLVGLRPTQGLVSRDGIVPLSHTQDIGGPLARSVSDLALALDVTVGPDSADPDTRILDGRPLPRFTDSLDAGSLRGARLGVLTNYFRESDAEIADSVRSAIRAMKTLGAEVVDVTLPGLDSLIQGSGVIAFEFKFDLLDYLKTVPNAPVHGLRDILDQGLYHASLESNFQARDTVQARDSDPYRAALAKRATLREQILAVFDSLRLDALVYPTIRQRPTLIGEPQVGTNCQLSAQTGFPAISFPAGFSSAGLPVGIELLGRPFADTRIVSLAYALEQSGSRRRSPVTTPALGKGPVPRTVAMTVSAQAPPALASANFTFDPARGALHWDVRITGAAPGRVRFAALQRVDSTGSVRILQQLSGLGMADGNGTMTLTGINRRALLDGRLQLSLFTTDRGAGARNGQLTVPAALRGRLEN